MTPRCCAWLLLWLALSPLVLQAYGRPVDEPAPLARRGAPVNDFVVVDTYTGLNARGVDYCNVWDSFNSRWLRHLFWAVYHPTNALTSSPIYWETDQGSRTFTQHFTEDAARVENWICFEHLGYREVYRINEYNAATEGTAYNFRFAFMDFEASSNPYALSFPDGLSYAEGFSMTELGSGITTEYLTRAEYEDGSGTPFAHNVRISIGNTGTAFPSIAADAVRHAPHFEFTNGIGLPEHCILIGNTFDGSTYSRTSWLHCYDGTDFDTRVASFNTYGVRKFQVFVHGPTDIRIIVGNERSGTGSDYTPATEVYRFNGVTTASGTMTLEQSIPGGGVMDIAGYSVDGGECFFLCRGRDNGGTTVDSYEYCWSSLNSQYELSRTITTTACSGVAYVESANGDGSKTLAIAQEGADSLLIELEAAPPTESQSQSHSLSLSPPPTPPHTQSQRPTQSPPQTAPPTQSQQPPPSSSPIPGNSPPGLTSGEKAAIGVTIATAVGGFIAGLVYYGWKARNKKKEFDHEDKRRKREEQQWSREDEAIKAWDADKKGDGEPAAGSGGSAGPVKEMEAM